jgi:hypothetical protein
MLFGTKYESSWPKFEYGSSAMRTPLKRSSSSQSIIRESESSYTIIPE